MGILMTIILIILKLFKCISLSWGMVFAPMIAEAIFWAGIIWHIARTYAKERSRGNNGEQDT